MLKLRLNRFWVEIWRRKPSFSVKCGFLLKLSLKHTLTHNFNIKFNLKIIDLCELRRHFHIFFKEIPEFWELATNFSIILTKSCHFYRKPEILRPFSRFLAVFRKSRKKAGETLRKQQFQVKSFGFVHTRTRRVSVCMLAHACLYTCTSCCARASVACVRAWPKVDFGKSPKFTILEEIFQNFSKNKLFYFWAGRRPSPKG